MTASILDVRPHVHVPLTPDPTLLRHAIGAICMDERRSLAYTDLAYTTLGDWERAIYLGDITPWVWTVDGTVGGMYWWHDQGSHQGQRYVWVGLFIAKACRKRPQLGAAAWVAVEAEATRRGIPMLFGACRLSNTPAQQFVTAWLGFHALGVYADWLPFKGKREPCVMYTRHPEHQSALWVAAEQRSLAAKPCLLSPRT